jgi:RNase P protein component
VAFAATRQVGNSPARHRHVRKLREFYRLNKDLFAEDGHYFLLVRAPVEDWGSLYDRLRNLLKKSETPRLRGAGGSQ